MEKIQDGSGMIKRLNNKKKTKKKKKKKKKNNNNNNHHHTKLKDVTKRETVWSRRVTVLSSGARQAQH